MKVWDMKIGDVMTKNVVIDYATIARLQRERVGKNNS